MSATDVRYSGLEFGIAELRQAMRHAYDEIISFVTTPAFVRFYEEMMSLDARERPNFIAVNLFNEERRADRGIHLPEGILLQTSAFGDRRPTLFAVKKMMPPRFQTVWENMNLTFNNEFREEDVPRSEENAWRAPLPVALQNALMARGANLECVPASAGVRIGMFEQMK